MRVLGNVRVTLDASEDGLRESMSDVTLQAQSSTASELRNGSVKGKSGELNKHAYWYK